MSKRITVLACATATFLMAGASEAEAETIPEQLIEDLQEDLDLEKFQAAGVVGNLARETGNFRYLQEINPLVEGSRGGIGYAQWTASRRETFEAWADGLDETSYAANYGFLLHELKGAYSRVLNLVRDTSNVYEAAEIFMERFLAPHPDYQHYEERVAYAAAYLEGDYSGAGCQDHHEVEASGQMIVVSMCPDPAEEAEVLAGVQTAMEDNPRFASEINAALLQVMESRVIASIMAENDQAESASLTSAVVVSARPQPRSEVIVEAMESSYEISSDMSQHDEMPGF